MSYYQRDVPLICQHVLDEPQGFLDLVTFVLLTIRSPISLVHAQVLDVRLNRKNSKYLWGFKRGAYEYVSNNQAYLYLMVMNSPDIQSAMSVMLQVPGLGLAKSAFVLQCLGADVGCMDTHNLVRFGYDTNRFKLRKDSPQATKHSKIKEYIEICQAQGTERLWNDWCGYVANSRYNNRLATADAVSAEHVLCVTGEAR